MRKTKTTKKVTKKACKRAYAKDELLKQLESCKHTIQAQNITIQRLGMDNQYAHKNIDMLKFEIKEVKEHRNKYADKINKQAAMLYIAEKEIYLLNEKLRGEN